jgi:general secretion pathway protein D
MHKDSNQSILLMSNLLEANYTKKIQEGFPCRKLIGCLQKFKALFAANLLLLIVSPSLFANSDLVHLADREQVRRQENLKKAERLIIRAERAQKDKNLKEAYKDYLEALAMIPAGSATVAERQSVVNDFSKTAVAYAKELIARGNYAQAENVAKTVLSPEFNPTYKPAAILLSTLEKGNLNTTIGPKFAAEREEVEKLLNEAEGYYGSGRFDLAMKRYEQVLNLDKYNTAARNGMELVNKQRTSYYNEAYNETRSRMLWEVDKAWERPVRKREKSGRSSDTVQFISQGSPESRDAIIKKLNNIELSRVDLNDVTVREAVDYLRQKSRDADTSADDLRSKGVNIVMRGIPLTASAIQDIEPPLPGQTPEVSGPAVTENTRISLNLRNVPLIEAIRYLTEVAKLRYKIDPVGVLIVPFGENTDDLFTKSYRVSPGFIPATAGMETSAQAPGVSSSGDGNQRIRGVRNAKEYLEQQGVPFPTGSFAQYVPAGSRLIVRNTQAALETVDALVEGEMGLPPVQVEIESRFIEISQTNVNELGFDWMLGPFSIGGGVYGDGGTRMGNLDGPANYNNFPFGSVGANPVTAGNRSGIGTSSQSAITANSINALLAGVAPGANAVSPGIFGISGVFTNPQFQMVIRALSQQRGVDLMSAPKVTTKSGITANIRMTRDFPFPTDYSPPQQPGRDGSGGNNNPPLGIVVASTFVSPATPIAFGNQTLGVSLDVTPQIGADNYTIDMSLQPSVSDFDGFIDYGSPIEGPRAVLPTLDNPSGIGTYTITENQINQPVFSIRRVTTNVTIWDGQTVALGGLIREDVQKVNDKVPILGDIPLAGRLFRSNVDQKIKKNLIIFVTARLMDAQGQPLIQDDEAEEFVEPLGLPEDLPGPRVETQRLGK